MNEDFERARKALNFLEHHQLDPSAANFEFALRYVMDPASKLARDVDEQTYGGVRLTYDAMLGVVERHLLQDPGKALDQRERTIVRQAEELGTLSSEAHDLTEVLGREVGTIVSQSSAWPKGASDLVSRLSEAERELGEIRDEFLRLRTEIGIPGQQETNVELGDLTRTFDQDRAWQVLERLSQRSSTYVLMVFSVDDLPGINNRFGRSVGDNVLSAFAATLEQVFQEHEFIRWTGNEFIIVATDLPTVSAHLLAEDVLTAFCARRLKLRGTGEWIGPVTASAGIVVSQDDALRAVLARARANALLAAAQGGNRSEG